MKVGEHEIEVVTQRYHGGWMSVAYLPDGKQVASAPWNTREAAEHDVYQQALMRLVPAPEFDATKTYEDAITSRRADGLLEHCGHCPEDFTKRGQARMRKLLARRPDLIRKKVAEGMMRPTQKQIGRRDFAIADTGSAPPKRPRKSWLRKPAVRIEAPPSEAEIAYWMKYGHNRVDAKIRALDYRKERAERQKRMRQIYGRNYKSPPEPWETEALPPPKAEFYPGGGGSAGVGGITST